MTQVATVIREIPKGRKGASVMQNGLTELQAAFVREYATDFCAKAAAIRAGYSEPSARQTGYMLLRNPVVREQLVKHMEKASSASVMSQREVLERDSAIASVDPLAVFDLEGGKSRLRPLDQIPEEVRRCISSIKETADGFRVAFHSLHPALDRLSLLLQYLVRVGRQKCRDGGRPREGEGCRGRVVVDSPRRSQVVATYSAPQLCPGLYREWW
jgi:phage terminase small subunit